MTLYFNLSDKDEFSWPRHCNIEKISISTCTLQQFSSILQNSPHLHSLTMNDCHMHEILSSNIYDQLNSLTLNDVAIDVHPYLDLVVVVCKDKLYI